MATFFNPEEWEPGHDQWGRPCWNHKAAKSPPLYLAVPAAPVAPAAPAGLARMSASAPNLPPAPAFNPASGVAAEAMWKQALAAHWNEYTNDKDGRRYWHNAMSGETTWEKPNMDAAGKPPPPPSPPAEPKEPAAPKPKEREQDQWEQHRGDRGRKYWYNKKTKESQYETPDCLRKYK